MSTIRTRITKVDPSKAETVGLREAALRLGVNPSHAYEIYRRGEWPTPVIRIGQRILIPRAALDRLLAGDGDGQ